MKIFGDGTEVYFKASNVSVITIESESNSLTPFERADVEDLLKNSLKLHRNGRKQIINILKFEQNGKDTN